MFARAGLTHDGRGIEAWRSAGWPTIRLRASGVSVMRQIQLVIGMCVAAGTALGRARQAYAFTLSQVQTRLRSPYGLSTRLTAGQNL